MEDLINGEFLTSLFADYCKVPSFNKVKQQLAKVGAKVPVAYVEKALLRWMLQV